MRWSPALDVYGSLDGVQKSYTTPEKYSGISCRLFRNEGSAGRFRDVTRPAGIFSSQSKAMGVAVCDIDGDGWPDLAVSNDTEPNFLFHNQGNMTFKEVATEAGIAVSDEGRGLGDADLTSDGPSEPGESGMGLSIIRAIADEVEVGAGPDGRGTRVRFACKL